MKETSNDSVIPLSPVTVTVEVCVPSARFTGVIVKVVLEPTAMLASVGVESEKSLLADIVSVPVGWLPELVTVIVTGVSSSKV